MKKLTVIGGGTGTYVVLSGLKNFPYDISVIVTTTDSGGSTGKLRDQYGALPPGDLRQCLVALSEAPDLWRKLFLYRFEKGDFKGHNFGNIFLTALEQIAPNYQKVIDMASYILQSKGNVIPVTFDKVHLCADYEDNETIETEDLIDTAFHKDSRIKKAYLKPEAKANPSALRAIRKSDYLIFGPGDLYTSIVPNFLVNGIEKEIKNSSAKIIYIANLMTKRGQTPQYTITDHVKDIEKYIGRKVDIVLSNSMSIPKEIQDYYIGYKESIVVDDLDKASEYTVYKRELLSEDKIDQKQSDEVLRSVLRHDSFKVAHALHDIIGTV